MEKNHLLLLNDTICVSGGWTPTVHLFTQSKGKLKYRDSDGSFIPKKHFKKHYV